MAEESFRFLHAADFHLEQPPHGLTETPVHLQDLLVDAPLRAAARVFEAALVEDVQFVVLSGDILDPRTAGPRAVAFLVEQFELLQEQKVQVYWCGGRADSPNHWPEEIPLPDNVHRFPSGKPKQLVHQRGSHVLATIIGMSAGSDGAVDPGEFRIEPSNRFTIAVAHGSADGSFLAGHKQIDYWALGGRHQRETLFEKQQTAHYPGTPQGRCPEESGRHGCTLVHVDTGRKMRTKFIPTDVFRWETETIEINGQSARNDTQRALRSRLQKLAVEASGDAVLLACRIECEDELPESLVGNQIQQDLLDWLRAEFGQAASPVWTYALAIQSDAGLPEELYEEDTILGDFLRAVRQYEADEALPLDFSPFMPNSEKHTAWTDLLVALDDESRQALLEEAARQGADLLRGEAT